MPTRRPPIVGWLYELAVVIRYHHLYGQPFEKASRRGVDEARAQVTAGDVLDAVTLAMTTPTEGA